MNNEPVELSYFSDAIIRRWYLPLGLAIVGVLIGLQLRPEVGATIYEAEARLLIRPVTDSVFNSNIRIDQIINEDTEAQLAASELVAMNALELLGDEAPRDLTLDDIAAGLTVKVRTDSQIVVISYRHESPDVAGAVTDAIAEAYLGSRTVTALTEKDRQANQLAGQISELTRDLTAANIVIATGEAEAKARTSIEERIRRLEEVVAIEALQGQPSEAIGDPIGELRAELTALTATVDGTSLAAAHTSADLTAGQIADLRDELIKLLTLEIDGGDVIQRAGVGDAVLAPNGLVYPAIGGLVGLLLGVVLAVFVDRSVTSRAASSYARAAHPADNSHLFVVNGQAPSQQQSRHQQPPRQAPEPEPAYAAAPMPSWGVSQAATAPAVAPMPPEPVRHVEPSPVAADAAQEPVLRAVAPHDQDEHETLEHNRRTDQKTAVADTPATDHDVKRPFKAPDDLGPPPPQAPNQTPTVASLADIAKIPRSAQPPVVLTAPDSEPAIALRRVARVIQNETASTPTPSVLITSAKAHEGRTTIASNLAAALRQDGLSVLLITHAYDRVITPGVHVLPPGMELGPEMEFPPTDRLRELLIEARELVDIVVIDGPAALGTDDAPRIASVVDCAVIVAVNSKTSASSVAMSKQLLETAGTQVLGLVTTARPSWLVRQVGDRPVSDTRGTRP